MSGDGQPAPPATEDAPPTPRTGPRASARWRDRILQALDAAVPPECLADPESVRRARLVSRFAILGAVFGTVYALFYLLIGHFWGVGIIVICTTCFAAAPFMMRRRQSIDPTAHLLMLSLAFGFTALSCVEGGLNGHAVAWLVSVPLCAMLLLGGKGAATWATITFLAATALATVDLMGIKLPVTYNPKWNSIVSTAGYLGLIIFMFVLGMIFENSRAGASAKMQEALAELAKSNERLQHLNNEKNEFLGIAAHDLKNPLTVIMGSAEVAGLLDDRDDIHRLLGNISRAAVRMRELITNLLDVNAIEQGKYAASLEPCNVHSLVAQSVSNNQPVAEKKMITLHVEPGNSSWVKADPAATLQILDNLISNAVKFSTALTTVRVSTLRGATHVAISVRDEGPGITEADQKKLFQKYSRLTAKPTGGESSTGLGLAIVKRLAEGMAGTIDCQSTPGSGAIFTLRLPLCEAPSGKDSVKH